MKAFNQLESLKGRIEKQQFKEHSKRARQYTRINDGMKQTQLMRDVEEEREILRL